MRKKFKCISFYFSALIFLALIGGCVTSGPAYFPKSLQDTPAEKLVKVIIPETEKIVMIDNEKVYSAPIVYVLPGKHTYTFDVDYTSPIYCNGPSYGLKADKDYRYENGETSSVVFMKGNYNMDATASEGQTVQFVFKPMPECKTKPQDYFKVEISK